LREGPGAGFRKRDATGFAMARKVSVHDRWPGPTRNAISAIAFGFSLRPTFGGFAEASIFAADKPR
jgi:hypothetical protein